MTKKVKYILIAILFASAILRVGWLSRGDTVNDEVFYAFRGLGMMDFDEAPAQTTPWEWTDPNVPGWAKLSFNDHPPLVFLAENISMKIFGESSFGFRLPSALLGAASVYLVYLLGAALYSSGVGLAVAALFAVTLNNVYISRTGMQESYVIFFMLLASYLFLKALEKDKYFLWLGVVFGLGIMVKYNVFILAPIFLAYLLIFKRNYLLNKKLWLGVLLALIIFTPVIIYNIELHRNFGHFDFQFSYIFGQHPEVWQSAPGKEMVGSLADRIRNFIPVWINSNSWLFLSFFGLAVAAFVVSLFKKFKENLRRHAFLIISILFLSGLLIGFIGPTYRFFTMLTPYMALAIGFLLVGIYKKYFQGREKNAAVILGAILIFEIFYSVNNQIIYYPVGPEPWLASKVRYENYNWGYNELGDYLKKELAGKMPMLVFNMKYKFLNDLRDSVIINDQAQGLEPYPALIFWAGNLDNGGKLWVLDRQHVYHAWPVITIDDYFGFLNENGADYFKRIGFQIQYFIVQNSFVPTSDMLPLMRGTPEIIYNPRGDAAFKVYKYQI